MSTKYFCPYCRTQQPSSAFTNWARIGPPQLRCKNCGRFYKTGLKEWNEIPWYSKLARSLKVLWVILLLEISLGGPALFVVISITDTIETPIAGVVGLVVMGIGAIILAVLVVRTELKIINESRARCP